MIDLEMSEHLSEKMPLVALGRMTWSDVERAHLARCGECRREWRLVRAAQDLGGLVEPAVDIDRITAGVTEALREDRNPRVLPFRSRVVRWALPLAVAAALVVALLPRQGEQPAEAASPSPALPELEVLSAEELEQVMEIVAPADAGVIPEAVSDLNEEELRRLLESLEG
jgi:hypothetical protein